MDDGRVTFGDFSWIFQRNCMIAKLFWEQIGAGKEGGLFFFSALNVCFAFGCYCRKGGLFSSVGSSCRSEFRVPTLGREH